MASVTRGKDEQKSQKAASPAGAASDDASAADLGKDGGKALTPRESAVKSSAPPPKGGRHGGSVAAYFTVYKKGQGYWTRLGTVIGAGVLGVMLAYTIFDQVQAAYHDRKFGAEWAVGFLVVFSAIAWYFMNKPVNVDFLIATDSEMKKVNWTSRKELMGSTRVVILFMFLIALFLFVVDEGWGWLMYLFNVLKVKPFGL